MRNEAWEILKDEVRRENYDRWWLKAGIFFFNFLGGMSVDPNENNNFLCLFESEFCGNQNGLHVFFSTVWFFNTCVLVVKWHLVQC